MAKRSDPWEGFGNDLFHGSVNGPTGALTVDR
jgi:hypothetical protein